VEDANQQYWLGESPSFQGKVKDIWNVFHLVRMTEQKHSHGLMDVTNNYCEVVVGPSQPHEIFPGWTNDAIDSDSWICFQAINESNRLVVEKTSSIEQELQFSTKQILDEIARGLPNSCEILPTQVVSENGEQIATDGVQYIPRLLACSKSH
jgi:hypothetical protein